VPYYGGNLKLFPFARITKDGMQLRILRQLHPIEGICNVASIFNGLYRDRSFRCLDFIGSQFNIEINESYSTNTRATNISSNNNDNYTADIDDNAINNNVEQIEKGFPFNILVNLLDDVHILSLLYRYHH